MSDRVELIELGKAYGQFRAIEKVDLTISAGRFVTLLGPSGCGKSTLLRMIAGFEDVTDGRILIAGTDVSQVAPNRRNVNMVFQDYALFPHLTVRQNVEFGLKRKRIATPDRMARVELMLNLVQLADKAARYPDQLSGGQRQRVALARALAVDPGVLLLDEPMGALDAQLRGQMQEDLRALQIKTGKTFVLVTHDQAEAMSISDEIVVMDNGRIEQVGSPEEVYRSPKSRFVASFVGEANYFPGRVNSTSGSRIGLDIDGGRRADVEGRSTVGSRGALMIRPEAIDILPGSTGSLPATVESIMYFGATSRIKVLTSDGRTVISTRSGRDAIAAVGEQVSIQWKDGEGVWFND